MSDFVLAALTLLLLLPGFVGVLLPIVPGIPYMFVITLVFALLTNLRLITSQELAILGAIALASIIIDYSSGILAARLTGASKKASLYGLLAMIIGTLLLPPFGGILAMFIVILLIELKEYRDHRQAFRIASASLVGSISAVAVNFILAFLFLILFIVFSF